MLLAAEMKKWCRLESVNDPNSGMNDIPHLIIDENVMNYLMTAVQYNMIKLQKEEYPAGQFEGYCEYIRSFSREAVCVLKSYERSLHLMFKDLDMIDAARKKIDRGLQTYFMLLGDFKRFDEYSKKGLRSLFGQMRSVEERFFKLADERLAFIDSELKKLNKREMEMLNNKKKYKL